jgi:LysR family transcriptional regulator, transcriptional activator for bauABCD operon
MEARMRRLSTIDLRLLRIFTTVVDCNGFQKAQMALNIAQSTLSSHIASLEGKLGSKLCDRGRGGFKLTPAGQETYDAVQALLLSIDGFEARMGRVHGTRTQVLRIATIDTMVSFRDIALDATIAAFHTEYPDVAIDLEVMSPQAIEQSVAEGRRDVAIGPLAQALPSLEYRTLSTETHSLYCGSLHPWFDRDDHAIAHSDFLSAHFSVRAYRYFDDVYRFGRATANASVSSMEAQEILILSGKYIGFLPDHAAARWVGSAQMRAVKPQQWGLKSRFFVAHEPSGELKSIKQAFVRYVVETAAAAQSLALAGPGNSRRRADRQLRGDAGFSI